MSFWSWVAKSPEVLELRTVKTALMSVSLDTSSTSLDTSDIAELCESILDAEDLLANPIIRSSILSNIPEQVRSSEHFKKIALAHEEISVRSPTADQLSRLLKLFSLDVCDSLVSNKSVFDKSCHQSADYMLFSHQRDVLKRALISLHETKRCLVHMPTGTGKTRTAMTLIAQWLNNNNGSVVWVTYSKELILQAANEFRKCWKQQGQYETDIRFYTGDASTLDTESLDSFDICFTSFAKIGREASSEKSTLKLLAQHTSLVVVDEAHQALAPSYKEAIDQFVFFQNNSALLGLTATPGRTTSDQEESNIELSSLFGHSKVTLQIDGYKNPIDYLIQNGFLAKPEYEIITGEEDTGKYHIKDLISKIKNSISDGHERIIVFTNSVEESRVCTGILRFLRIAAYSVNADVNLDERSKYYREYLSDRKDPIVLCNYGVLTTGFDAPKTSCVIIARPVSSLIVYSQIVGRALRGPAANGTKYAKIITMLSSGDKEFLDLVSAFDRWNYQWSSIQ